jgi:hypothetical protein
MANCPRCGVVLASAIAVDQCPSCGAWIDEPAKKRPLSRFFYFALPIAMIVAIFLAKTRIFW